MTWVELPEPLFVGPGVAIAVTATHGRFRWAADPDPLVLIGVTTAPQGRQVRVGDRVIELTGATTVHPGLALGPADFAGQPPSISTDQFVTVNVSHLRLEYAP